MPSEILVFRGDLIESRHQVSCAVVRGDGSLAAECGDPDLVAFWRSCAKPFQAVPSVMDGAADSIRAGDEELALACASHNGEARHVALAQSMLERCGATERDLVCGPHASLDEETARDMAKRGEKPSRLHNNCSGKHALMVAHARHKKWGSEGYAAVEHPLQRQILGEVASWTGLAASAVPHATDGCGVPSFALPLRSMALAWARLGRAAAGTACTGITSHQCDAMRRLTQAIAAQPFLLAGTNRLDTDLIAATKGRVLAKVGAEGVYCAAIPELDLGLALKVEDGATRALSAALLGVLDIVAADITPKLESHRSLPIRNTLGAVVGYLEARVKLDHAATK